MAEDQPIPAIVTGAISGEVTTISKPALSRADNGDPVLHPKGLAELGDQGIVFDARGSLLWARSSDGDKIKFSFVSQMLQSIKIKRPNSEDDRRGIRSLPTRLIGAVKGFNKYDYAYPNLPSDFFDALADFYQEHNSRVDDSSQPLEETGQQPKSAEVTGIEATLHDLTLGATAGEIAMARAILEPLDPEAAKRVRRAQEDLIDSSRLSGAARHEKVRSK